MIGPSPYHYYSGMGPGLLSGIYKPQEARFHVRKMAEERGATFIEGRVTKVDPVRRALLLDSGREVPYDAASFNTGSEVPPDLPGMDGGTVYPVKPIENLLAARKAVLESTGKRLRAVVVGGGAGGVEIAANLGRLALETGRIERITLVSRSDILEGYPPRARSLARDSLAGWKIESIEGTAVRSIAGGSALLENGKGIEADMVFVASGIRPSRLFRDSGLPTGEDGGLLVTDRLQCPRHPELFGGGDCISLEGNPLARVGVYAVRQNPVLHRNLLAFLEGRPLSRFDPGGAFLVILNLGNGTGLFRRKGIAWDGPLAFRLKEYLDKGFMRKFQV